MEEKKLSKKIGSIFWWCLAVAPLILALIYFIGYHITFNSGITSASDLSLYHTNGLNAFNNYLEGLNVNLFKFIPSVIRTPIITIFNVIFEGSSTSVQITSNIVAWFVWVFILHCLCDILVYIPRIAHHLLDKYGGA